MRVSSLDEEIIPSKYLTERFLGEQERKQTIYEESSVVVFMEFHSSALGEFAKNVFSAVFSYLID